MQHCNDCFWLAEYNKGFLAASGIGDKYVRRINNSTDIKYRTDLEDIYWSHKLYILPLTLATAAVHNNQRYFVHDVLRGWDKGELILRVAEELNISRYFAWKLLMTIRFHIGDVVEVFQKVRFS